MTEPFAQAVASFDPTSDAVLLWTRLTASASTDWVLARAPELSDVVASGTAVTGPQRDGTVVVDVPGLAPATTYWYRFTASGGVSPVGRTRTLPGEGADALLLGLVSCADFATAPLTVYRALAQREVDLVLHLGDYIYETGAAERRRPDPPHEMLGLADYRRRYAQIRTDPDAQALHLRHPVAVVVDDHDLADNAWRGGSKHHVEAEQGPWSARALAAMTARAEWVPSRRRDPGDVLTTWRSLAVGDLAEVLLLDSRLCGRDQQAGEEGSLPLEVGWHFVDPYDPADEPAVDADRWLAVERGEPRWREAEPFALPARAGLPAPLPPRPDDVRSARRAHRRRRAAGLAGVTVAAAGAAGAVVRALLRAYADLCGEARRPCSEEMCTSRPQPRSYIAGQGVLRQLERDLQHEAQDQREAVRRERLHRGDVLHAGVVDDDVRAGDGTVPVAELAHRRVVGQVYDRCRPADRRGHAPAAGSSPSTTTTPAPAPAAAYRDAMAARCHRPLRCPRPCGR